MTQHLDPALIGERAPRYTSYPTAAQFHAGIGPEAYGRWLGGLDPARPVSLYLHIPFCNSMCWYCACNKKLATREAPVIAYAEHLGDEIALVARHLPARMRAGQVHFGGGTPHSLPGDAFDGVMARLAESFDLGTTAERAMEIDPRTFTADWAPRLARHGFTRVSLGVQEFDARVQQAINRVQPFGQVADAVDWLRAEGIGAINFDLMYGLPYQTEETLAASVTRAATLRPDRIALFGYAHVPWMASVQKRIPEHALPDREARIAQADLAARLLVREGYERIGLDHFALPHDSLARAAHAGRLARNFQGYTDDACESLIGLGASAISMLPQGYAQAISEPGAWRRAVAAGSLPVARGVALTGEDRLRRRVIERIMCDMEVDLAGEAFAAGEDPAHFAREQAALGDFAAAGLVEIGGGRVRVTPRGQPALRAIAARFDSYFANPETRARHSASV